jgi:hypothetical protein
MTLINKLSLLKSPGPVPLVSSFGLDFFSLGALELRGSLLQEGLEMAFRSTRLLVLLLLSLIALCRAENLSTGEDVNAFLDQYIAGTNVTWSQPSPQQHQPANGMGGSNRALFSLPFLNRS